jgi:hypothetical protein
MKTSKLVLCRELIALFAENNTKNTTSLCRQNAGLLTVKPSGKYSHDWALKV